MRITIYLISIVLTILCFFSCSKGEMVKEPLFGSLSLSNFAGSISVIEGSDRKVLTNGTGISLAPGKNRFRFYDDKTLLLDTLLEVKPLIDNPYFIFKPNSNSAFRILDLSFNGFDKEILPDSGVVKISLANFSSTLPGKVNIFLTTNTYVANNLEVVQVGEYLNANSSFSIFQKITLGKTQLSRPQNLFVLTIKDAKDNTLLGTVPLTLPIITTTGKLLSSVYLIYINSANSATILMSK